MDQIIKILLTSGILLGTQSVVTAQAESPQTRNQMMEFASSWGFKLTECQDNVAIIRHDITGEKACVIPTSKIGVGKFVYDSANNKIFPETVYETSSVSETVEKKEYINPQPQTKDPRINPTVFNFNNVYDYSICLDLILLAYEDRQLELQNVTQNECSESIFNLLGNNLSKDLTLQIVASADAYATKNLENKLYPPLGIRRRVAINLGYIYEIDINNDDVLKYVSANNQ